MKKIIIAVVSLVIVVSFVVVAGMYKFNYLASKEGYDCDGNRIKTPAISTGYDEGSNKNISKNNLYVSIEFRPGSLSPEAGLQEMTIVGSNQVVYISKDIVLTNKEIATSSLIAGPDGPQIEIIFTENGTEKFAIATENNMMKPLGILIDGLLVSAPTVQEKITSRKVIISGNFSESEAQRITNGLSVH